MKIYTRRGDGGESTLPGGERTGKDDIRMECLGCLDELSAHLGVLIADVEDARLCDMLHTIQLTLFSVGCTLGVDVADAISLKITNEVLALEHSIDELSAMVPPFSGFVLAGANRASAQAHVCRTVCRRTERRFVAVGQRTAALEASMKYLNRLSDYLFLVARVLEKGGDMRNDNIGRV